MQVSLLIFQIVTVMSLRWNPSAKGSSEAGDGTTPVQIVQNTGTVLAQNAETVNLAVETDIDHLDLDIAGWDKEQNELNIPKECKKMIPAESVDIKECTTERNAEYVINNYCLSIKPGLKRIQPQFEVAEKLNIGIITSDNRVDHPADEVWSAYAKKHGYTYIKLIADENFTDPMDYDWSSLNHVKKMLHDPKWNHINHFMYTELDQWPVQPHAKLEAVFEEAGLLQADGTKKMAIIAEYPCDNIRGGGIFNMGNFLFVRDEKVEKLFDEWYASQVNNPHDTNEWPYSTYGKNFARIGNVARHPEWPARQGAFSQDDGIWAARKELFHRFEPGNPFGSPFGTLIAHFTGGYLEHTYDPDLARANFKAMVACVKRRLNDDNDRQPCSVYPRWAGGSCLKCKGSVKRDGTVLPSYTGDEGDFHYTTCCGGVDSAVPLETFAFEVKKGGIHKPGEKVDLVRMKALDAEDYGM